MRLTFVDETTAGDRSPAWHLDIFEERLTLREVIRRRVFQEVAERNAAAVPDAGGRFERADAETEFTRAVEAFSRNGFLVLVDERQVCDLDAEIELAMDVKVTYLRLIPLAGG
jgi:hypothetical protein